MFFSRSETIRVGPSWSDPDWRSELIRSDFCTQLFLFKFLWLVPWIRLLAAIWRNGFSKTIFFDRKWRKQQHKRKPSKTWSSNYGPEFTSDCIAESQEHTAWIKICEELNSRKITNWEIQILLGIFQSLTSWFQHVGLMRPLPKFGTCEIFANFFPHQKLEIF